MNLQGKKRGPVSKNALYQAASAHAHDAIAVLVELMNNGSHEATRVGAAKTILAKCIPDLKATEVTGGGGVPLQITFTVATKETKEQLERLYERSDSGDD